MLPECSTVLLDLQMPVAQLSHRPAPIYFDNQLFNVF
jgi:hypothetical protein